MFPGMILELEGKADALTDTERDRYRAIEILILIPVSVFLPVSPSFTSSFFSSDLPGPMGKVCA